MTEPDAVPVQNTFNISNSSVGNAVGSGSIYYNGAAGEPLGLEALNKPKQTILFLAANPISTQPMRLDQQVREIAAGLQRSKQRDRFVLEQRWAVRSKDLQRALLDCQPSVVHFAGMGYAHASVEVNGDVSLGDRTTAVHEGFCLEEGLVLEDGMGQPNRVRTAALSALFKLFVGSVNCVVLNACYSEAQARAIAQHIPHVIGMKRAITDAAAIEFAVGFYDALLAGRPVPEAFEFGKVAIQLADIPEHDLPVLLSMTSSETTASETASLESS